MAISELRLMKHDGTVEHFPVANGDLAQAELRASLSQHPGDIRVAVTEHAFIRVDPCAPGSDAYSTPKRFRTAPRSYAERLPPTARKPP